MRSKNGWGLKEMVILLSILSLVAVITVACLITMYDGGLFR